MSTTLEDRVILLLRDKLAEATPDAAALRCSAANASQTAPSPVAGGHGFWKRLDAYTGISSQRWRKVIARLQRPTPEMIQALARMFPQHAFWLSTGITDAANGHIAPTSAQSFPERSYSEDPAAIAYFRSALILSRRLFEEGCVNLDDGEERMCAAQRTRLLDNWHESPLGDAAYDIAHSDEYAQMETLWQARERARKRRLNNATGDKLSLPGQRLTESTGKRKSPTTMACGDPRTAHQDERELFYRPASKHTRRFALNLLNIAPGRLSVEQYHRLSIWMLRANAEDCATFAQYLEFHGLAHEAVLESLADVPRRLTEEDIKRFRQLVNRLRRARAA